jgi:ribose transport system permease protein
LKKRGLFIGLALFTGGFSLALISRYGGVPLFLVDSVAALWGKSGDVTARTVAYQYVILFWYVVGAVGSFVTLGACQAVDDQRHPWVRPLASPAARALIALMLVLLLGVLFDADGAFYKIQTHRDGLRQASVFGILACGMTLVIIAGGIDLAVGSVLALAAVCFSLMSIHWDWSPLVAIPICLAIGASCGWVSGSLTAFFKIQPFIATLAMMVFARGLAKTVSGGMKVSTAVPNPDGRTYRYVDVPDVFRAIDSRILNDNLSMVTVIFLVCAVAAWVALARHRWGRELYAIGGNEEAARLSGVNVNYSKIVAYVVAGLLAAVAGICQAAQEQQGDPEAGWGYELTAIAIVVIGGTNLMGGRGGIGLTLIGTLTIGYLEKILSINAVPESRRLMLTGVIIVAAVLTQRRRRW